ncbi:MAG: alpha-glucosidase, partial [Hyphomicrobiales bacterium]|nr:alpha-glucosidase [Hyphomicrobiales bacterium]
MEPIDMEWWRGAVIYQIYPRSYADSDGDGIGDLRGVAGRLEHVADLGADAIWLSPFFKSPMKDFGYDVEDYCAVDPLFGTMRDFDRLVAKAHKLGLKVMIDQVLSHTADTHPWFVESRKDRTNPKANWYVWADPKPDGSPPNNWMSIFGGVGWQWDTRRRQYYMHNFLVEQPDLNFHEPQVREALLGTVKFWLERGVDGFRLDTVNYYVHDAKLRDNPPNSTPGMSDVPADNPYGWQLHVYDKSRPENLSFLESFRALLDRHGATASVGEVGAGPDTNRIVAEYTGGSKRLHMCYGFDLLSSKGEAAPIRAAVEDFERASPDGWMAWALSNHDVVRAITRWRAEARSAEVAPLSIALMTSLRGSS